MERAHVLSAEEGVAGTAPLPIYARGRRPAKDKNGNEGGGNGSQGGGNPCRSSGRGQGDKKEDNELRAAAKQDDKKQQVSGNDNSRGNYRRERVTETTSGITSSTTTGSTPLTTSIGTTDTEALDTRLGWGCGDTNHIRSGPEGRDKESTCVEMTTTGTSTTDSTTTGTTTGTVTAG
jgi:hypothetical protein